MLLSTLGISITPILTTLGVGGLAVALGLQDTLANLFAGLHITLAGNLRVGDYVRLESGDEGYIDDIKWRATRIRTLPGNIVLIPNARLAQNIVTNYHLPDKYMAVLVQMGVHYSSDLERVEEVITDEARRVLAEAGGVETFKPFIRYHTLADSSINLTVILRAREFVDQYLLKHEFIKRVVRRFAKEGIVIPFPIRALNMVQERPAREPG
jgi:small-conductance mechanosensitive channel